LRDPSSFGVHPNFALSIYTQGHKGVKTRD
jgi:hypothetical protein